MIPLILSLLNEPIDSNLKVFRNRHDVTYVKTLDEGVLIDVDTMSDYLNLKNTPNQFIQLGCYILLVMIVIY